MRYNESLVGRRKRPIVTALSALWEASSYSVGNWKETYKYSKKELATNNGTAWSGCLPRHTKSTVTPRRNNKTCRKKERQEVPGWWGLTNLDRVFAALSWRLMGDWHWKPRSQERRQRTPCQSCRSCGQYCTPRSLSKKLLARDAQPYPLLQDWGLLEGLFRGRWKGESAPSQAVRQAKRRGWNLVIPTGSSQRSSWVVIKFVSIPRAWNARFGQ